MSFRAIAAFIFCLIAATIEGRGQTYVSSGSGGELLPAAQVVSAPTLESLTQITGSLVLTNGTSPGNLFEIYISNPGAFSASTVNGTFFDSQLFLFSASGLGIEANDDDPNTGQEQALLPAGTSFMTSEPAGDYYLLIEGGGRYAADASANLIFPNFTDGSTKSDAVVGPTGAGGADVFASLTGNSSAGGSYSIALTGAQYIDSVPEPSDGWLMLVAGGVICAVRKTARVSRGNKNV